jgi:hypothetical protein
MKNIRNIFSLYLVFLIVIVGCGTSVHKSSLYEDQRTKAEHRFDPIGFPGDNAVITGKNDQIAQTQKTEQNQPVDQQYEPSAADEHSAPAEEIGQSSVLFRVQVFATKSFDEAQEFAANIEALFPEGVFVEYQMPYYKVRVGEFYEPDSGEEFLDNVKEMGFKNAWLVRVLQ